MKKFLSVSSLRRESLRGLHWLEVHRVQSWFVFGGGVAITMLIEDGCIALGLNQDIAYVIAAPAVCVATASGYLASKELHRPWRIGIALLALALVTNPTTHDLVRLSRDALVAAVLGIVGLGAWYYFTHVRSSPTEVRRSANSHLTKLGKPKNPYMSQLMADTEAQRLARLDGAAMNSYQCDECGLWHVGHAK